MKKYTNIIMTGFTFLTAITIASSTTTDKMSPPPMIAYLHLPTPVDCMPVTVNCSLTPGPICMSGPYQAYGKNQVDCNIIIYRSE